MLTQQQMQTLRSVAEADPVAAGYVVSADDVALADWFNQPTAYVAWRTVLTPEMSRSAIVEGATQLDALTVGKRDSLFWLCSANLNPSIVSVRAAIDDLCGTQNTLKAALVAAQKRLTTRAEKALASGAGTTAVPGVMTYEGALNYGEASTIRSL